MASRVWTKTASSGIIDLISRALDTTEHVRNAGKKVRGASEGLDGALSQLQTAESFLILVRDAHGLQTPAIQKQVEAVAALIQELDSILDDLTGRSLSNNLSRHKIRDGDKYDNQLKDINSRFEKAMCQVSEDVVEVPVGLSVNHPEGYRVVFNILNDTNNKVNQVFKMNLALMEYLQKRQMMDQIGPDGTISLLPADVEAFKQRAPEKSSDENLEPATEQRRALIYGNSVQGNFTLASGNIGVESGYVPSFNGVTTIRDNKMGADAKIITGDVGGQAAVEMMRSFW